MKLFHDQSPRKYGTGPGSNSLSLDLQSDSHLLPDTLPTALSGPVCFVVRYLFVHSTFAIILMGTRELVALLSLSSWCLVVVVWLYLAVPWVSLRFVIVVLGI